MKTVTAAILIKDKKILIAKRKSSDKLANKWEFPGGTVEDGETPEQCLQREMKEEFCIDVCVSEFFGESLYQYSHESIKLLAYLTQWQGGVMESKAHDDFCWISVNELRNYDFAPADIPFVEKIRKEYIEL